MPEADINFYINEDKLGHEKDKEEESELSSLYSTEDVKYSSFYTYEESDQEINKTKKIIDIQKIEQKIILGFAGGLLLGMGIEPFFGPLGFILGLALGAWVNAKDIGKVIEYWKRNTV